MAIEIRIESAWDTDDGEGRRVEVSVAERERPSEDLLEGIRYFASGDVEALKRYLCKLIDQKSSLFEGPHRRECAKCGKVVETEDAGHQFACEECGG